FQYRRDSIVSVLKNVRFDDEILANDAFNRIVPSVDQRLQILDDRGRKSPRHGRSINRDLLPAKAKISVIRRRKRARLNREIKRALVESRVANHLAAHTSPEDGFEHVLLEP